MSELETHAASLVRKYVQLGGTRRAKLDDNIVDTRKWEDEPREAADFWAKNIEGLEEEKRKEVETYLPSANAP